MPPRFARTFKEAVVQATRLPLFSTLILALCLAAPRVWADDWLDAPPPAARPARPPAPRLAQPAGSRTPRIRGTRQAVPAAYQPTLANPTRRSSVQMATPGDSSTAQDSVGDVSPEELFPIDEPMEQYEDHTGINPLTLPIKVWVDGREGDENDHEMVPATGMTLSSGAWLNRGCWYSRSEVIYLERSERGRHRRTLATEDDPTIVTTTQSTPFPNSFGSPPALPFSSTTFTTVANPFMTSLPFGSTGNYLPINPSLGFTPGARITLGTYLGTDAMNRDSAIEFTFQGLNHWSNQYSISAISRTRTRFSPTSSRCRWGPTIPTSAPGFAFANFMQYTYNASFNSYELNFKLSKRMGARPHGLDARRRLGPRRHPQLLPSLYGGLRLISYNEGFFWRSEGTDPSLVAGNYQVMTHNTVFGPQCGTTMTYQHENWRFTGRLGGGTMVNWAQQHSMIAGYDVPTANSINGQQLE